jgi:phosphoglycolate phosphatase-like HAD superfamily hydrolase
MKTDLVVFDLDGTLISSHITIYKATFQALKEINIEAQLPEKEFYGMIGLHFEDIFEKFGFRVPDFNYFLSIYKSLYFNYIDSSTVYPNVETAFENLKRKGIKISLLTTKGQDQAELILKHFNLFNKFNYVMGRRPGLAHKPSPEPLLKICDDLKIEISKTLIVGDSEMDIQCGKNANAKTCGVTYGYRSRKELLEHNPDFLIDHIIDLDKVVNYS